MNKILYQGEKFNKLTEDIKFLMERSLNQKNFDLYVKNSEKMIKNILKREEVLNEQVEKAISDFQLGLEDLKERLNEFDYLLDEINNSFE